MKKQGFNKFGGTEFRVAEPINEYFSILSWVNYERISIENNLSNNLQKNFNVNWDEEFKKYVKNQKIYNYSNDKKIKSRFNFVISHLKKWGFLKNSKNLVFNFEPKKFFDTDSPVEELFFKKMYLYWEEFREMVNFIISYNESSINIEKLNWAFAVFDYKEDKFEDLYTKNKQQILEEIADVSNIINIKSLFKKKINEYKILEKIFNLLRIKEPLSYSDYLELKPKEFKYIKRLLNIPPKERNVNYLDKINFYIFNHLQEDFLLDLKKISIEFNIEKEYMDMFNRWMCKLGLYNSNSKTILKSELNNFFNLENLKYLNEANFYSLPIFKVDNIEKNIKFPFKYEEVIDILNQIQSEKFEFKEAPSEKYIALKHVPNFALAEYFVNLFFTYSLNINPQNFKSICHTKLTKNLYPIFSAPGHSADFDYYDSKNNIQYIVETTILKTEKEVVDGENYSISKHAQNLVNANQNIKEINLYFVNFLKFNEEQKKELESVFLSTYKSMLEKNNVGKNIYIKKFSELINLNL